MLPEQNGYRPGTAANVGDSSSRLDARVRPLITFSPLRQARGKDESRYRGIIKLESVVRHRLVIMPVCS
jgi:hypothetical protein